MNTERIANEDRDAGRASLACRADERGIALIAVLAVLFMLMMLAVPFMLSMRNEDRATSVLVDQAKAAQSVRSTLAAAESAVARTDPAFDPTPHYDTVDELQVDVAKEFERFGEGSHDAKGTIRSVRTADEQAKVDLNSASPFLLANLLAPSRLIGDVDADEDKSLTLSSTAGLLDNGLVWIDGELIYYGSKTDKQLVNLKRAYTTTVLESLPAGAHPNGRPVVDYRVITTCVYPYKSVVETASSGGAFGGFTVPRALKDISSICELTYGSDDIDRVEKDITTYAIVPAGGRFGTEARAVGAVDPTTHPAAIEVTGARSLNAGTVVRLRAGERIEFNLVTAAVETGPSRMTIVLQEAPRYDYAADELLIAPLLRAPVNVNTCSNRVLVALLTGLKIRGASRSIDSSTAEIIATRLERARPLQGEPGLVAALHDMMGDPAVKEIVTEDVASTVLVNAINPLDTLLETSTAPFCYRALGNVSIDGAVSENLKAGRESGRSFAREVVAIAPGGARQSVLTSQLDFYEAGRVNRASRFWTTFPVNIQDHDNGNDPPIPLTSFLQYGRVPAVTAADEGDLLAKGREPYTSSRPTSKDGYRDNAAVPGPRVLHCDEPYVPKKTEQGDKPRGDDPNGWDVSIRGPLVVPTDGDVARMYDDTAKHMIQPFGIEFWWTPGKGSGEQYLFDSGENEISNRIMSYFDGENLVFRVADTAVPDYITGSDSLLSMMEIRYAFDDGLKFDPEVPYHLSFYARGTKPSDLVLLVDGVPRGRRAYQTRLRKSVGPAKVPGGPFAKIKGYGDQGTESIEVEDSKLFPPYGVLRIGDELIEYTSKDDKKSKFIVGDSGQEPFGGRQRRGTYADPPISVVKQGQKKSSQEIHPQTQTVELYGYSAPIACDMWHGDTQASDPIEKFGIAMVNPNTNETKKQIDALRTDGSKIRVGVGLLATATEIPITGLGKATTSSNAVGGGSSGSVPSGMFSKDGGFALLVSSPAPPPSTASTSLNLPPQPGQNPNAPNEQIVFAWNRALKTTNGMLGRIEMIYYSGFEGGNLTGCSRAGAGFKFDWQPKSNLEGGGGGGGRNGGGGGTSQITQTAHDHMITWENWTLGNAAKNTHDPTQPVFVIPVSVRIGKSFSSSANEWAIPEVGGGGGGGGGGAGGGGGGGSTLPEMIQVGLGFAGESSGTEWIRYDTMAKGCFVRDNPQRVNNAGELVGHYMTVSYTLKNGQPPAADLVARAVNFENIGSNQKEKEDIIKALGTAGDPSGEGSIDQLLNDNDGCLAFRGVLSTGVKSHGAGDRVLPVFRTFRGPDPDYGRPGPRDFITLIDPKNNSREEHRINFGYCEPDVEGWDWSACHFALDAGVDGTFTSDLADMLFAIDATDPDAGMKALANEMLESRQVARIVKFPSGELPMELGADLNLGGDLKGDPSPAGGVIDEVEFFTPTTPAPSFENHHFVLDYFDEKRGEIWVYAYLLRDPARKKNGLVIEQIDPMGKLPEDGFVVQIGDEFVACKGFRREQESVGDGTVDFAVLEVAEAGRGYLGTPIQFHGRGEGVREMTFLRISRLAKSLSADANVLQLADASDFDERGVVAIGRELIGYSRKQNGNFLFMPPWREDGGRDVGLLRGSYGTTRDKHDADTLVYQFPVRYLDRYRPQADDGELGYFGVAFNERRAFFKELSYTATGESDRTKLVVEALVGGRGSFVESPKNNDDRFTFGGDPAIAGRGREILRQGDSLELRVATRYLEGAFDSRVFDPDPGESRGGSNDWKRAPELRALGIEWIASPARLAYEEWR